MAISNTQLVGASLGGALQASLTSQAYQSAISSSMQDIDSIIQLRNTQRTIFEAQDNEITQALGQKLTENDLQVLQASARLKAATAETGTSGGTTALAQVQPYIMGARNRANIIQGSRNQKLDLARRNIMSRLDAQNKLSTAIADIPSASQINLSMISSTLSGIGQGLNIGGKIDSSIKSYNETNKLNTQNQILKGQSNGNPE